MIYFFQFWKNMQLVRIGERNSYIWVLPSVQSLYVCNFIKFGVEHQHLFLLLFISGICSWEDPLLWMKMWTATFLCRVWKWHLVQSQERKTCYWGLGAAPLLWAMGWILKKRPQRETLSACFINCCFWIFTKYKTNSNINKKGIGSWHGN